MKQRLIKFGFVLISIALMTHTRVIHTRAELTPTRISSSLVNLGEVHKIFLAQGLVSVIQLPYPVTEVKVGNPNDVQVQISKTLPSELTLILKRGNAKATNLIARCGARTFVFDLIPSQKTHQDLVKISGSYGAPSVHDVSDIGVILIDSSLSKKDSKK